MKYLSYDIEILEDLPEGEKYDLRFITPSIAAVAINESEEIKIEYFYDEPFMSKDTAKKLVNVMLDYQEIGIPCLTWNGLSFDFPLLGYYSGMLDECAYLAINHIDMMFLLVSQRGHNLSLDAALKGANLETKIHTVMLNNGMEFSEMSGAKAPELWRNKEYEAVKEYLRGDVIQPLLLANMIEKVGGIWWICKSGRNNHLRTKLYTVKDCLYFPKPNTSWQTNPKSREEYYSWIPKEILDKELQ